MYTTSQIVGSAILLTVLLGWAAGVCFAVCHIKNTLSDFAEWVSSVDLAYVAGSLATIACITAYAKVWPAVVIVLVGMLLYVAQSFVIEACTE